ncbi:outer membrane beta-barrel protein [Spirosoma aureum]|uniref:Outer membrane beta-barrel protein n=1 Tax=Spirosoma aureum TaxID=2692134 RepID=A0A6G9ANE9_9BACT|nr:outer membrane beta-barrel protein [Spirosoma aureum]QIP14022.1 outer membrane beta-barrel protein [Spirosoma aureum]
MKKIYLCFIVIVLTMSDLVAQSKNVRWGMGVFGGINRSRPELSTSNVQSFPDHYGLLLGLDLNLRLNKRSSFHLQLSYTSIDKVNANRSYRDIPSLGVSTIKIPLLYRYRFLNTKIAPFLEVGVGYNQATKGYYRIHTYPICDPGPCQVDPNFEFNYDLSTKSAVSAIAGIGANVTLGKISIPITVRYEHYGNDLLFSARFFGSGPQLQFENISLLTGINF